MSAEEQVVQTVMSAPPWLFWPFILAIFALQGWRIVDSVRELRRRSPRGRR